MSDILSNGVRKPMEQPENDLSKAMGKISLTTDGSNKTSPSLSDMPIDVLRKVSKSLRALVDNQKPACKSIRTEYCMGNVNLIFDDQHVMYTKLIDDDEDVEDYGIVVLRDDFKKAAFDDLASTLKNPKLRLEKFCTSEGVFEKEDLMEYYNETQCVLESLNHQLSVKEVDLHVLSPSNLLSVLPYLKPGVLEEISLSFDHKAVDWRIDSTGMDQVACLEQWKQAKELEIREPFYKFPMKYATSFKRFKIHERSIDEDKFIQIRDFLFKHNHFEQCTLSCIGFLFRPALVSRMFGAPVSSNATGEVFHYPIPKSDFYLEFKKAKYSKDVEIEKKKRGDN